MTSQAVNEQPTKDPHSMNGPWADFWLRCTNHGRNVLRFMWSARQMPQDPAGPHIPDEKTRLIRGRLIVEEALELLEGLGLTLHMSGDGTFSLSATHEPDIVEVVDGCADLRVVTTGTLLAFGVPDHEPQQLVDASNLAKFAPGHSYREDGKLIKPADWKKPDLLGMLLRMGFSPNQLNQA